MALAQSAVAGASQAVTCEAPSSSGTPAVGSTAGLLVMTDSRLPALAHQYPLLAVASAGSSRRHPRHAARDGAAVRRATGGGASARTARPNRGAKAAMGGEGRWQRLLSSSTTAVALLARAASGLVAGRMRQDGDGHRARPPRAAVGSR